MTIKEGTGETERDAELWGGGQHDGGPVITLLLVNWIVFLSNLTLSI